MTDRNLQDVETLADIARSALEEERFLRKRIPRGGVLHIERRLPFFVVYRRPAKGHDRGTARLVTTQPAYLIVKEAALEAEALTELVSAIAADISERLEAFLLIEVWSAPVSAPGAGVRPRAKFRIVTGEHDAVAGTAQVLADRLGAVKIPGFRLDSTVVRTGRVKPPDVAAPLLPPTGDAEPKWHHIGIEIPAIFHGADEGVFYPGVLDRLRRPLGAAVRAAVFRFCADNDIHLGDRRAISLAPRHFEQAAAECDREILEICGAFDLLMLTTPVNSESAWQEFEKAEFERAPVFYYRPLPFDPAQLKRRLFSVPLERIHDPVVEHLFEDKRLELDQRISLLRDRGSPEFLFGSLQLFGGVEPELLELAQDLLRRDSAKPVGASGEVGAEAFCAILAEELEWYRQRSDEFDPTVQIRDDIPAGLMVSEGALYVSAMLCLAPGRVDPLIQHELGTHIVTHFNGSKQPFGLLASGLAHFDSTQEGLAVLAEYAVDGLTLGRVRTIAGRVVAVQGLIDGASFVEVFQRLREDYRFSPRTAYNITMRVFRGGGLTKDAVYLKGMLDVMRFLDGAESLDLLLLGKLNTAQAPLIDELLQRGIVKPPGIRPRYCDDKAALERILHCGRRTIFEVLGVAS
ncbi:MAG: flavohemoglobin expression-modulating QEGLA motif protein [Gammaproteobacteria bacterium]